MYTDDLMYLNNYSGILHIGVVPVLAFSIANRTLKCYEVLDAELLPWSMRRFGVSYHTVNDYFKNRVVQPGAQWNEHWLKKLGLESYDFEAMVRVMCGRNNIDNVWVKEIIWSDMVES